MQMSCSVLSLCVILLCNAIPCAFQVQIMASCFLTCYCCFSFGRDDFVVRVKAQVMTKDESTGGWVPLGRGGMSIVGLRRLIIADGDDFTAEYLLHGQRIADKSVSNRPSFT